MGRLTIEKDVKEMRYLEQVCNMTFPKDNEIWYQDYTTTCTLRNLIREFAKKMDVDLSDDDDNFDEEMLENLMYVEDRNAEGLLALLNHALIGYDYLRYRLKKYEDLEADGKLITLPCAVGDTVYEIPSKVNYELNILNRLEENNRVYNQKIKEIIFTKRGWYVTCDKYEEYGIGSVLLGEEFGESWFLTEEEAEAKLKELENGKKENNKG